MRLLTYIEDSVSEGTDVSVAAPTDPQLAHIFTAQGSRAMAELAPVTLGAPTGEGRREGVGVVGKEERRCVCGYDHMQPRCQTFVVWKCTIEASYIYMCACIHAHMCLCVSAYIHR